MTNPEKPSRNEDDYFARQDADLIERQRKLATDSATAAERKSHFMRCPKCGGHLTTSLFNRIQIEQCPDCHGVWLDAGELDTLVAHPEPGVIGRMLGDLLHTFRKKSS
ncbi:MAG: zf-TFIIB domain-containing protein [Gemmatimonadota bacterium]